MHLAVKTLIIQNKSWIESSKGKTANDKETPSIGKVNFPNYRLIEKEQLLFQGKLSNPEESTEIHRMFSMSVSVKYYT